MFATTTRSAEPKLAIQAIWAALIVAAVLAAGAVIALPQGQVQDPVQAAAPAVTSARDDWFAPKPAIVLPARDDWFAPQPAIVIPVRDDWHTTKQAPVAPARDRWFDPEPVLVTPAITTDDRGLDGDDFRNSHNR